MASTLYSVSKVPFSLTHPCLNESPVQLELIWPGSYCRFKPLKAPLFKDILAKLTPKLNPSDVISLIRFTSQNPDDETSEELHQLFLRIFGFVNEVVRCASDKKFQFDFSDFVGFFVENIQDTTLSTRRAYAVTIVLSEKADNVSAKAGLIFREMSLIKL